MAYDQALADDIRAQLGDEPGLSEKRMFGGLAFLVDGHLAVAASGQGGILVRCEPAQTDDLVDGQHVRRMEMRGREMDGWLRVDADATRSDRELKRWVGIGVAYARSLPPE